KLKLDSPTNDIGASWTECNPDTSPNFSAVEYYFARDLQKALRMPIGVIESDWGGSPAEVWMQRGFLQANLNYRTEIFGGWIIAQDSYERSLAAYNKQKNEAKANGMTFTNAAPR